MADNTKLFVQLDAIKNVSPDVMLAGAKVLRDATWENWHEIDPDAQAEDVIFEPTEGGAQVIAQEDTVDMPTMEFDVAAFMRPAIDENLDAISEAVKVEVNKQLRALVGRS
jgi:hypothetical protein